MMTPFHFKRLRVGFLLTDEEDCADRFLIRILGFTVIGISGGWEYDWFTIHILGFWIGV